MKKATKTVVASGLTTTGNVFKDMLLLGRADTEVAHLKRLQIKAGELGFEPR